LRPRTNRKDNTGFGELRVTQAVESLVDPRAVITSSSRPDLLLKSAVSCRKAQTIRINIHCCSSWIARRAHKGASDEGLRRSSLPSKGMAAGAGRSDVPRAQSSRVVTLEQANFLRAPAVDDVEATA
jgi:hypothetical protein